VKVVSTIKDQVYEAIKENILNENLKPGQRIQELQIAKEMNVSRSPVRSAINELIGEGLLESIPNKSVRVRQLSEKDIVDAFEFRIIIEKYAMEKAVQNMNDRLRGRLLEFRQSFLEYSDHQELQSYVQVDSAFHEFLVTSAGNQIVTDSLNKVSMLIIPFRVFSLSSHERFLASIKEHTGMIDGLLNRNLDEAWQSCMTHLMLAKEEIIRHLKNSPQD